MKKTLIFSFLLISFSSLIAQNKIELTLKDGSILNGFGRINIKDEILYRKTEDGDKVIYNYKTVKRLSIYADDSVHIYEYKVINGTGGSGSIKLLESILVGNINLYQDYSSKIRYYDYSPDYLGGGYNYSMPSKTIYYITKNGNDKTTNLKIGNTYSKRFKKIAKEYFASCPDLLEKINNKYFKRYGIESIVKYYNENCQN